MDVVGVAWRTDLALREAQGSTILDRDDHLVIRTPSNPLFHWGNFLLLGRTPSSAAEADHWLGVFAEEFPAARHVAIGVDPRPGTPAARSALATFAGAGLEVSCDDVLAASDVAVARPLDAPAEIRQLSTDADWEQRVGLALTLWADAIGPSYEPFARRSTASARALTETGSGRWYGAFVDGQLVAELGIFRTVDGLGRYQSVATLPEHRRRGLAGTLLHTAGRYARDELGCRSLVIVAEADGDGGRIYRRQGFCPIGHQLQAYLSPGS